MSLTMKIGPNMFFLMRVYEMTETELAEEIESDRDLVRQDLMSESEFMARTNARDLARDLRYRDSVLAAGLDFTPIPGGLITMKRSK
jgi:hypothetical protein